MTFKYPIIKILYDLLEQIKSGFFMIIIIFVVNFNNNSNFMMFLKIMLIVVFSFGLLNRLIDTLFTKVEFAVDGVRMYTGLISKSERFIPREKFENVQTNMTVLQRLFGVHKVVMETGDAAGDVTLTFVKKTDVEKMQSYVLAKKDEKQIVLRSEKADNVLFTPTFSDIFKAAIMSFSFLALLPIAWKLWSDFRLDKVVDANEIEMPLWGKLLLAAFAIVVALTIGLIKTFNSYYKYKISMDAERIYVQKGWLSKQSFSLRKSKVQAVIYKQSWYQKLLHVTTIKLISTGEVTEVDDQQINEFFPYLPTQKADEIIAQMLPQFVRQPMSHKSSLKAKKLIWLRPPIFAAFIALIGLWQEMFYFVAGAVLILTYISRMLAYKNLAFLFEGKHLQARTGGFIVETIITKRPKLLEMKFTSSNLQRKVNVMSLKFSNRSQPTHETELKDINEQQKQELLTWFEQRVHEVKIDPKTEAGSLKKEAIRHLLAVLKLKQLKS